MTWNNPPKFKSAPPKHELMTDSFILIDRGEAIRQGLTTYFTGNPCPYGHIDEIYVSSGTCKTCQRESSRAYGRRNIKKIVDRFKVRVYGVEPEEFNALLAKQNNLCASCDDVLKLDNRSTHLDHNHKTGKIRGILCHKCNTGLGLFNDDIVRLQKAIEYLRKTDGLEKSSET